MFASAVRLDLHNHTCFSPDGVMTPRALLLLARKRGLHCLAVTDHDSVRGAWEAVALSEEDPSLPRVIPGIELTTTVGEIVGLYVSEPIPAGLGLQEAVDCIRAQGGLVYLPHPYALLRRGAVSGSSRLEAAALSDIIEVVNGRSLGPRAEAKARQLARLLGKPAGAGSDAHRRSEVGSACVLLEAYPTRETLVPLLTRGVIKSEMGFRQYTLNWGMHGLAPVTRARRRLAGERPRG